MILITGATGTNGREIVKQLSDKGVKIRLMVRKREDAGLAHSSNLEYVFGNFDDFASLGGALAGVERAFLLSRCSAEQVTRESNFIRAAKRAGVHHVVRFSILGAELDSPCSFMRRHGQAEQLLRDSGMAFTMLRPSYFMQNLLWFTKDIRSRGVFYSALPATCKHSHVDVRDIAAVAVAALTESGHEGKVYRITGPEALTYQQVAEILSDAAGKKVRYDNSLENYSRFLKDSGLDVNEVLELDAWVAKGAGEGSAVTNTIFELTGQQPIRFAQFAEDYSQRF